MTIGSGIAHAGRRMIKKKKKKVGRKEKDRVGGGLLWCVVTRSWICKLGGSRGIGEVDLFHRLD